mgnify:CR=1 FL=1
MAWARVCVICCDSSVIWGGLFVICGDSSVIWGSFLVIWGDLGDLRRLGRDLEQLVLSLIHI